jgi:hypothetical protein
VPAARTKATLLREPDTAQTGKLKIRAPAHPRSGFGFTLKGQCAAVVESARARFILVFQALGDQRAPATEPYRPLIGGALRRKKSSGPRPAGRPARPRIRAEMIERENLRRLVSGFVAALGVALLCNACQSETGEMGGAQECTYGESVRCADSGDCWATCLPDLSTYGPCICGDGGVDAGDGGKKDAR